MSTAVKSYRRDRQAGTEASRFLERGGVYLNNRHYDPTTGTFLSVDPLVGLTGEPYLYGSANPATKSDPTGLIATIGNERRGGTVNVDDCRNCKVQPGPTPRLIPLTAPRNPPNPIPPEPPKPPKQSGLTLDDLPFDPQDYIDGIIKSADGWTNPGGGPCLIGKGAFGGAVDADVCAVVLDGGNLVFYASGAVGAGADVEATVGAGILITNAQRPNDLRGLAVCGSGSAAVVGGASQSACGGITGAGVPTGVWTVTTSGVVGAGGGVSLSISGAAVSDPALLDAITGLIDRLKVGQAGPSWCSGGSLNVEATNSGNVHTSSC